MQKHNRSVFILGVVLAMFTIASVHANEWTDLYTSPNMGSGMAIPSGGMNPGLIVDGYKPGVTAKPAGTPADTNNVLGCGGVGQGEFTSALFNMPETFGKFQRDVNSMLAKQILAMNYIMPQTAALFDQLNNFGDQRYQIFQNGCNLDTLRQNAKDQYLNACVAKIKQSRVNIIKSAGASGGGGGGGGATANPAIVGMSTEQIDAWAYAQAWEICSNQYVSDTTAFDLRKKSNKEFATQVRASENVTKAIIPLLCPSADGKDDAAKSCWQELLIPQVRVCLDGAMGCDTKGGYAVKDPLISMQRMFDTMRYMVDDTVVARRVNKFTADMDRFDNSLVVQAAREAGLSIGYATLFRMESGSGGALQNPTLSSYKNTVEKSVMDFQADYLNCKDPDILSPLLALNNSIQKAMDKAKMTGEKPTLPALAASDFESIIKLMKIKMADDEDLSPELTKALSQVTWSALGCSANHTVPLFDPNIVASLKTQCLPQDRYAFYSMAGYDTAMAATRDVYRYLNNRLKQVYTRLMLESTVPSAKTSSSASPTLNPELNSRLALAVKETMIPYMESQLTRLDEVQKSRGEFARRVQQIYADKSGCVYGAASQSATPAPSRP